MQIESNGIYPWQCQLSCQLLDYANFWEDDPIWEQLYIPYVIQVEELEISHKNRKLQIIVWILSEGSLLWCALWCRSFNEAEDIDIIVSYSLIVFMTFSPFINQNNMVSNNVYGLESFFNPNWNSAKKQLYVYFWHLNQEWARNTWILFWSFEAGKKEYFSGTLHDILVCLLIWSHDEEQRNADVPLQFPETPTITVFFGTFESKKI